MHFAQPLWFNGLILLAGLALFYAWRRADRKKQIRRFADDPLSIRLMHGFDPRKDKTRTLCMLFGFCFLLLALARPQWGSRWEQMKRRGLDILIALDISKSMFSEDVKPNRLERSKLAIKDFVKRLKGDRVGLIAFSGDAYLACPLTSDYSGFNLSLDDLTVGSIQRGGTNICLAIREAMRAYEGAASPHKILILITDGENHEKDPVQDAGAAKKEKNIHIYTIGIGTPEGELVPLKDDTGALSFVKDKKGLVIKSRLEETLLQKISEVSDGRYVRATPTEFGLDLLYEKPMAAFEKKVYENKSIAIRQERFQLFLAIAFILFFLETLLAQNYSKRHD